MAVSECRVAVAPGAVAAMEETIAALEELRWTMREDLPSGGAWVVGYFPAPAEAEAAWRRLAGAVDPGWLAGAAEFRELPDADWAESYKIHFKAWRIGRRHWVPEWERRTFHAPAGHQVVWLDPGMAFGTGAHETTRLCCERLVEFAEKFLGQNRAKAGAAGVPSGVLDAGCGSGILAVSAARFGLGPVAGFDNDPVAVRVSRENANLNDVADRVEFLFGDLTTGLAGRQAGLVLANIQTDVLCRFSRELVRAVAPGGWLSLSGILARELGALREHFAAEAPGWMADSRTIGEWADLLLVRGSRDGLRTGPTGCG
jgi:ribosomal protein L11 methyltransferase